VVFISPGVGEAVGEGIGVAADSRVGLGRVVATFEEEDWQAASADRLVKSDSTMMKRDSFDI